MTRSLLLHRSLILTTLATCAFFLADGAMTLLAVRLMPPPASVVVRPRPFADRAAAVVHTERLFGKAAPKRQDDPAPIEEPCPSGLKLVGAMAAPAHGGSSVALVSDGGSVQLIEDGAETTYGRSRVDPYQVTFERPGRAECTIGFMWPSPAIGTDHAALAR